MTVVAAVDLSVSYFAKRIIELYDTIQDMQKEVDELRGRLQALEECAVFVVPPQQIETD